MDEVEQLRAENEALRARIAELEAQLKRLMEQLGQNSRNSNWPSSRDRPRKPKPKRRRKYSEQKAGGQKGHKGHTLALNPEPDRIEVHRAATCQQCQAELDAVANVVQTEKRQVLDLPPLQYITTEHQVETVVCPHCQATNRGSFPAGVTQPAQYGSRVLFSYIETQRSLPTSRPTPTIYLLCCPHLCSSRR